MFIRQFKRGIRANRVITLIVFWGCWLYLTGYVWLRVPYFAFGYRWENDLVLQIRDLPAFPGDEQPLQNGDRILLIDGVRPDPRGYQIPPSAQKEVQLHLERNDLRFTVFLDRPPTPDRVAILYRLPATILSLLLAAGGTAIVWLADANHRQARQTAWTFLLGGMCVIGIQGYVHGVPGARLIGMPGLLLFAQGIVYVSFLPRAAPLPLTLKRVMCVLSVASLLYGLLVVVEGAFLLPETSVYALYGVSLYRSGMLFVFFSTLFLAAHLFFRWLTVPESYERRQVGILTVFIGLGTVPAIVLGLIPSYAWGHSLMPLPLAIALLTLCPSSYFYVLFRNQYLGLDAIFGRLASAAILAILVFCVHSAFFGVLRGTTQIQPSVTLHAAAFVPLTIAALALDRPLYRYVCSALLRHPLYVEKVILLDMMSFLATNPKRESLVRAMRMISSHFDIPAVALLLLDEERRPVPVACVGEHDAPDVGRIAPLHGTTFRHQQPQAPVFKVYRWADVVVPLVLTGEEIGYLAAARPRGAGLSMAFVELMQHVAEILAIGSHSIGLFENERLRTIEAMRVRLDERRRLEAQLHDGPLQTISYAIQQVHRTKAAGEDGVDPLGIECDDLDAIIDLLRESTGTIRDICAGLHPPVIGQGVYAVVKDLTHAFSARYGLPIALGFRLEEPVAIDIALETAVYYVLHEALTNAFKHAHASEIRVDVSRQRSCLRLEVSDNGVGLSSRIMSRGFGESPHQFGLTNMLNWAEMVGGQVVLGAAEGGGTRITLTAPLSPGRQSDDGVAAG